MRALLGLVGGELNALASLLRATGALAAKVKRLLEKSTIIPM